MGSGTQSMEDEHQYSGDDECTQCTRPRGHDPTNSTTRAFTYERTRAAGPNGELEHTLGRVLLLNSSSVAGSVDCDLAP